MKTFKYLFQSIIIYFFFIIGKAFGINYSRKIFAFIFQNLAPFFKSKKIIQKNLNIFDNKINDEEKNKIISSMWRNYGLTFIEYIFLNHFRNSDSHIEIVGEENLKNVLEKNKTAIFVSGHFANYELMSMEITKKNIKLATIYRPLNNYFLNPFMEYLRKKYVCKNQIKKGINGVREAIEFIKEGTSIAMMIDQRVSEGQKVNFFGKPASTTTLPAQLAIKYKLPIIPVFIERIEDAKFKVEFFDEINVDNLKDKEDLTKNLNEILEQMIVKNPYQWIWTHNRWK